MNDNDIKSCDGNHLTISEIAGLLEDHLKDSEKNRIWDHLSNCRRCMEIYRDSVIDRGLFESSPSLLRENPELVEAGLQIAARERIDESRGKVKSTRPSPNAQMTFRRYALAAASIVFLITAGVWLLNTDSDKSPQMPQSILGPVRHAVGTISRRGPIIMHGGEYAIAEKSGAYRSGFVPIDDSLRSSLEHLYDRYESDTSTPDGIYWLAAGYAATGQIDLARDLVADARKNRLDELRILNLEALIAFMEGDLERAEVLFRSISDSYPADAVSLINFAVVLKEQGKLEESSRILTNVRKSFGGTPFATRAQMLLDTM